jgi:major type 1 subunit fimbrin (pilin)
MQHIKLAAAMAFATGIAFVGAASAGSSNGTIRFTAEVTDTTCTVSGGFGTNQQEGDFSVDFDKIELEQLSAPNSRHDLPSFQVVIGGSSCRGLEGKVASVSFDTNSALIDGTTGKLKNEPSDGAQNVQLGLTTVDGNDINLANPNQFDATFARNPDFTSSAALVFKPYLQVGNAPATPGAISTSVAYVMSYN